jgi:predicted RNase H-like HicB family nuclease
MKTYLACVYKDPDSSFGVSFPDLKGCFGAGDTYEEALENAKISLREYAAALAEDGDDMPKPRTHSELIGNASEKIEFDRAAFIAEVPFIAVGERRRINVSIDDRLLAGIDRACKSSGLNRSAFLAALAGDWLQQNLGAVMLTTKKKGRRTTLAGA